MKRILVPSSILLLGEYAVLEPGGLGIYLALNRFAKVQCNNSAHLQIVSRAGRLSRLGNELTELVVEKMAKLYPQVRGLPIRITVDTRPFFNRVGQKKGYGSSAAVCLGLATILMHHALGRIETTLFAQALAIHREFQGGKGSGYDLAASWFGGCGLFYGGESPRVVELTLPWLRKFYLYCNHQSVPTAGAIQSYSEWKLKNPALARDFLVRSNSLVGAFSRAADAAAAGEILQQAKNLGVWLGEQIGVPAQVPQENYPGVKAVGAGDELFFSVRSCPFLKMPRKKLKLSKRGVLCQISA